MDEIAPRQTLSSHRASIIQVGLPQELRLIKTEFILSPTRGYPPPTSPSFPAELRTELLAAGHPDMDCDQTAVKCLG
ncbi:hypothetical protein NDU88_002611 [Pleurodeles waltl]|uniref:Uncharacterized protein n=1 Tax=Pleurodeles waltl TaxID=8319 RepID=A0AAV7PAI8_PLEWA|nr:hypothetical protein NDU88_002611 [Pleurodeles waltl]